MLRPSLSVLRLKIVELVGRNNFDNRESARVLVAQYGNGELFA